MSSIRLSGSTSGYYDLTVPAAAGTNSIDLSTLVTDNHSGNLTVTGNVTISGNLDKNQDYNITDYNKADGTRLGYILFRDNGPCYIEYNETNAGQDFRFASNNQTKMTLDATGRMTVPNQPGWHGTHADNYATTYGAGTVHNMTTGHNNDYSIGNHFDYSTNRFTVPITGYYLIYGWDIRDASRTGTGCAIGAWKNGVGGGNRIASNYHQGDRAYSFTSIAYLAVNDWVSFGCTEGGGVPGLFYGSSSYSGYGIRLIG